MVETTDCDVDTPQQLDRRWVWRSTAESTLTRAPSILAIVETAIAIAGYAYIAVRWGTLHLTIAACVAPLLLLRTPESMRRALVAFEGVYSSDKKRWVQDKWLANLCGAVLVAVAIATIVNMFELTWTDVMKLRWPLTLIATSDEHPTFVGGPVGGTVESIPLVMSLSLLGSVSFAAIYLSPVVYVFILANALKCFVTIASTLSAAHSHHPDIRQRAAEFVVILFAVLAALPAWLYRWSVKGTAVLLGPLVWTVYDARGRTPQVICESKFYEAVRLYSLAVLALFFVKITSLMGMPLGDLVAEWAPRLVERARDNPVLSAFIVPDCIPWWQMLLLANALLTWILYFYADRLRLRGTNHSSLSLLELGFAVRSLFAVSAIFGLVHISVSLIG